MIRTLIIIEASRFWNWQPLFLKGVLVCMHVQNPFYNIYKTVWCILLRRVAAESRSQPHNRASLQSGTFIFRSPLKASGACEICAVSFSQAMWRGSMNYSITGRRHLTLTDGLLSYFPNNFLGTWGGFTIYPTTSL